MRTQYVRALGLAWVLAWQMLEEVGMLSASQC
jgi:hypothetical protein